MSDLNFISENTTHEDIDLFFGPIEKSDEFVTLQPHWIMAHVMHRAGIFPSVSQARKNGWNTDVPKGFSSYIVGKKRHQITIFNTREDRYELGKVQDGS